MATSSKRPDHVIDFIHDTSIDDIPASTLAFGQRCLLDLLGVAAAGRTTELSTVIHDHAVKHFGSTELSTPLLFDGRNASPAGAALAAGMTIDSIDAHDGHKLVKGHVGCHQLPALLAFTCAEGLTSPTDFLASLVVGYEIATRAGIALHATAPDYHTSGAWGALSCAALGARILGMDHATTFEAMGIGEYHGPRSQMMRVIDHPTMLKDGSGWGAMAGVSAAYLAADGFTGAPAVSVNDPKVATIWGDLGSRWRIEEQYFKPFPVCRWAQPAVEATLALCLEHSISAAQVASIHVATFTEAARLVMAIPQTTEHAQYSLPFPVAAAVVRGTVGAVEVTTALNDPTIRALAQRVEISEDDRHNDAFPANRFARVTLRLIDGTEFVSTDTEPRGDPENHLSDLEIRDKFAGLAHPVLGADRSKNVEVGVDSLIDADSLESLFQLIFEAV